MQEKPPTKFLRWIRFIDRIQFCHRDELVHRTHVEASRSLAEPNASKSLWVKIQQTENDYRGVHPDIVEFWKAFSKAMKRRNIPIRAFEFVRTAERQQELYEKGRRKASAGFGAHQYGMAVDIIHATRGWNLSKKEWDCIGAIGKEIARKRNIKLDWGGDWNFYDPAHWEIDEWQTKVKEPF